MRVRGQLALVPFFLVATLAVPRAVARLDAQALHVTVTDVPSLPWTDLQPGIQIKPVVGATGTFVYAELDAGARTPAHHHTQEQANFGLGGSNEISIGGRAYPLGRSGGTLTPAEAEHFIGNAGAGRAGLLEFQPFRRLDLLPPRPAPSFPSAPSAVSVPEDAVVSLDFQYATAGWESTSRGVRRKALTGATCVMVVWDMIGSDNTATDIGARATRAERFAYIAAGKVDATIGGAVRKLGPGTLLLIPRGLARVPVKVASREHAVIVGFDQRSP